MTDLKRDILGMKFTARRTAKPVRPNSKSFDDSYFIMNNVQMDVDADHDHHSSSGSWIAIILSSKGRRQLDSSTNNQSSRIIISAVHLWTPSR